MAIRVNIYWCVSIVSISYFATAYAAVEPIWLSPTNVDVSMPGSNPNIVESYAAEKGVWTNTSVGIGSRAFGPLVVMDSKGILWIMFGYLYAKNPGFSIPASYNVWNYDPKADLYRYVWGNNDTASSDPRNPGELRVPSETNHPGAVALCSATIDNNDNIWFFSENNAGEWWMFNTTSMMFTRIQGLSGDNQPLSVGSNPGQPGEDVWPGRTLAACTVTDSQNNIWVLGGFNSHGYVNAVWHFNTTSLWWTFVAGSVTPKVLTDTYPGGLYYPGCNIDENDKIWLYGGYGEYDDFSDDSPIMWTFDTRGDRDYAFESGPVPVSNRSLLFPVSMTLDYNAANRPPACEGCVLIDRMDGTLMLLTDGAYAIDGSYGATDQVWQYSKSLKQWRLVYGSPGAVDVTGTHVNYRQTGSNMPGRFYGGVTNGKNMKGDVFSVGGGLFLSLQLELVPGWKDIWLIPNDQCSSPTANKCDANADCIEEMIGYSCECKQGYTGDGFTCVGPPVAPVAAPVAAPVSSNGPSSAPGSTNTPSEKTSSASVVSASIIGLTLAALSM